MALFPANMPFTGELAVDLDYLYIESDMGGAINQYDSSGETIARFDVTFKSTLLSTILQISLFLAGSGITEQTEIEVDGVTYLGLFSGVVEQQHISNLYILKTSFKGKEQ